MAIENRAGNAPRNRSTNHQAIASGRPAFGRTAKNFHWLLPVNRSITDAPCGAVLSHDDTLKVYTTRIHGGTMPPTSSSETLRTSSEALSAPPSENHDQVPWYVWCSVAAVTFAMVGVHWDISWHRLIGRDTFWTPAHIAIHMWGVLAG